MAVGAAGGDYLSPGQGIGPAPGYAGTRIGYGSIDRDGDPGRIVDLIIIVENGIDIGRVNEGAGCGCDDGQCVTLAECHRADVPDAGCLIVGAFVYDG